MKMHYLIVLVLKSLWGLSNPQRCVIIFGEARSPSGVGSWGGGPRALALAAGPEVCTDTCFCYVMLFCHLCYTVAYLRFGHQLVKKFITRISWLELCGLPHTHIGSNIEIEIF